MSKPVLGWVYVLSNPSFREGMIKIGFTNKPTPQERAVELSRHTGVPTPFVVIYAVKVPNAQAVETRIHQILQHQRAQDNREFFDCSVADAIKTIKSVAGKSIVQELDNRKSSPKSPKIGKTPTPKKTSIKHKNHGGIITKMISALIVFGVAMLIIGWLVEQKENRMKGNKPPVASSKLAQQAPQSPQSNQAQATETQAQAIEVPPQVTEMQPQVMPQNEPVVHSEPVPEAQAIEPPNVPQDEVMNSNRLQENWQQSGQALQAAWDKIPNQIRVDLLSEQEEWLRKKTSTCLQAESPMACETQFNHERATYLRGFSID